MENEIKRDSLGVVFDCEYVCLYKIREREQKARAEEDEKLIIIQTSKLGKALQRADKAEAKLEKANKELSRCREKCKNLAGLKGWDEMRKEAKKDG